MVPVSPARIVRRPVHCVLKNGGEDEDFSSTIRSVTLESFLIRVLCEHSAEASPGSDRLQIEALTRSTLTKFMAVSVVECTHIACIDTYLRPVE